MLLLLMLRIVYLANPLIFENLTSSNFIDPPVNLGGIGPNPIMNQPGSGPPPPMGFIPSGSNSKLYHFKKHLLKLVVYSIIGPMPGNCAQIQRK